MTAAMAWHAEAWKRCVAQAAAGRLPHALLLAGPRGVGKGQFAQALAAYLLCEAPAGQGRPCNECRGCLQRAAGTHPNLFWVRPAEDKRDIAVDDLRELRARLQLTAHYGGLRVVIIEPAEALNANGINALLKTIEEPPPATHLVLVAERWRALPATLRSRCQMLRLAPPSAEEGLRWLKAQFPGQDEAVLKLCARVPTLAAARLEPEALASAAQWAKALAELGQGSLAPLRLVAERKIKRDEAQAILERWISVAAAWLQALLVPPAAGGRALPPNASAESLQRLIADSIEGLVTLDRVAPGLMLESIMIRWAGAKPRQGT